MTQNTKLLLKYFLLGRVFTIDHFIFCLTVENKLWFRTSNVFSSILVQPRSQGFYLDIGLGPPWGKIICYPPSRETEPFRGTNLQAYFSRIKTILQKDSVKSLLKNILTLCTLVYESLGYPIFFTAFQKSKKLL